jgi:GTP-binding protein
MSFDRAEFITSAVSLAHCPAAGLPEICLAGRSNVGKSSLINRVTNRGKLARTSNTPGKTQQMNYYKIDERFHLVDLPGFGYAKVPEAERRRWGIAIREYLLRRDSLRLTLHIVDARHKPTALDEEFFYWMASNGRPFAVIVNKADKLSAKQLGESMERVAAVLADMNIEVPVIACSADRGDGIAALRELILEFVED